MAERFEIDKRALWTFALLSRRDSNIRVSWLRAEEMVVGGRVMLGRLWKMMEGMAAETVAMYREVELASYGAIVARM